MRSKGRQELEALLGVPVMAVVPEVVPAIERYRRRRRRTLALSVCVTAVAVVVLALLLAV